MPRENSSPTTSNEWQQRIGEAIQQAKIDGQALRICSGRSKVGSPDAEDASLHELNLSECSGVIDYDPSELCVTVQAGTSLKEVTMLLQKNRQQFAFEPPSPTGATIGGMVATGITGSSMPYKGSLRNALLALRMVNGFGDTLHFGAPVIKNVAGFDVSRLMAGSYGTLGVLIELTLRVSAMPESQVTLAFECDADQAIEQMVRIDQQPWPISGQSWHQGQHYVRLSGSSQGIAEAKKKLGGETLAHEESYWRGLINHNTDDFINSEIILRQTCRRNQPVHFLPELHPFLIDWAGGLRWYSVSREQYLNLFNAHLLKHIQQSGSHMWRCIFPSMLFNNIVPLAPVQQQLHQGIKTAFDPYNLCNPDLFWRSQIQ